MNRVVFIFLSILLIVFPLTIENIENENVSYFELVKNITTELIHTVVKAQVKNPEEINFTNDQVALLKIKLDELEVIDFEFENNLIQNYERSIIQINKDLNKNLAIYEYRKFVNEFGGIKGIYLNSYDFVNLDKMSSIKAIIDETVVNTLVIDVKTDHGHLMYDSNVQESYEINNERVKFNKTSLEELKTNHNLYLIGRVVAFQDPLFAKTYEDSSVFNSKTNSIFSKNGQYFLDPSDQKSRNYVLNIAIEACNLGFDEIQFDYIRYPDAVNNHLVYEEESNFENRTRNINSFLYEATKILHGEGCLVSADIFGYVLQSESDNGIGQHLETIVKSVDFISPMVYPSHYSNGSFGYKYPNKHPYEVVTAALNDGLYRGTKVEQLRPYLQGFWHTPKDVRLNIKAAEDIGLDWIIWNNSSVYDTNYFTKIES
tara:strand:- start:612 stop:1901 length:1290 start_codon:yes stop_codon:yes gene_type:complete